MLVWSDGQSYAPVAVVAKLHYFGRLDVTKTVSNLARNCPEFWRSAEFRATLQGSNIMALDTAFFAQVLPRATPGRSLIISQTTVLATHSPLSSWQG